MNSNDMKSCVKQVIGSCVSAGILVENKDPKEVLKEVDEGKYDKKIAMEKTELSAKELEELEEEKKKLAEERKRIMEENKKKAEEIMNQMKGKDRKVIASKMEEEEIPQDIIDELLPKEAEKDVKVKEEKK